MGQTLGAATEYSSGFASSRFPPDGLLGMGFESISVYGANPAFQSFISQNQVDSHMFGFKFSTSGSELFLGGVNEALFTGEFTWLQLSNEVCHIFKCV